VDKEDASQVELTNRAIQRHLLLVGYRIGAIDGILGGKTSAAMEAFAKKHRLDAPVSDPEAFLEEMLEIVGG
jgi:peptidoglycan hydrolase-like protein with peptidoglycan-binding domain